MVAYTIEPLLQEMIRQKASDLYLTVESAPSLRVNDAITPLGNELLTEADIRGLLMYLIGEENMAHFDRDMEFNSAIAWENKARFRINAFRQQQNTGMVIRRIQSDIPTIDELKLPPIYKDMSMEKRGLVLVVGPTGSGKSMSLAAMIGHRNTHGKGHIITVEDPIEFIHPHKGCIISQRDVGIDTHSFEIALKNALRQRPDVVLIGEIRDRNTMEQAIIFAETGHLCLATLHANNANQTIERIVNFFPEEKYKQVLLNLSLNLKAIFSQRLVTNRNNGNSVALEILLNRGLIKSLIEEGKVKDIRELLEKGALEGMQTFDQSLLQLFSSGIISEETALAETDNPGNLKLMMRQRRATIQNTPTPLPGLQGGAPLQHFKI